MTSDSTTDLTPGDQPSAPDAMPDQEVPAEEQPTPDPKLASKSSRDDRLRRQLIGPFTVAQVGAVLFAIVFSAVALVVLTSPLAVPPPSQPQPGSSPFVVGSPEPGLRVGDLAPELEGTTVGGETVQLTDLDGNPVRLADLRGRPVWINFWASWCPPCQAETPILREMYDKYASQGLSLVGVSVQESTVDDVRAYVDKYQLDYTVGFDATSAIFHAYHAYVLPTQFFVDKDGVIRYVQLGGITREQADRVISSLLAGETIAPATPPASPAATPAARSEIDPFPR
jgi:cytochrome c biogenesis protein CcmG/thiol:disulfide interchange protein DsbE